MGQSSNSPPVTLQYNSAPHSPTMAGMAFANFSRRCQNKAQGLQDQEAANNTGFKPQETDFGAKQMTNFFEENNKTLTKKWSCDEEGVPISKTWAPAIRIRTFSFSGADYLRGGKIE